jgi:hypothetical protein
MMCSGFMPPAGRSKTSDTQMRLPRMQGLPKHIFGSMEIRLSSSSRVMLYLSFREAGGQATQYTEPSAAGPDLRHEDTSFEVLLQGALHRDFAPENALLGLVGPV